MKSNKKYVVSLFVLTSLVWVSSAKSSTIDDIKKRGHVICGVSAGLPGFSAPDSNGNWTGLDVDVCRALGSAVFGNANKVKFVGLSAQQRFTALQSGEVDVLTRNTTHTLSRDTSVGLNFAPTNYYDGQGFMVKKKSKITSAKQLNGAAICVQQGTTTERNLADYFRQHKMKMKPIVMEGNDELFKAFLAGRCDALTTDASGLAAERTKAKNPAELEILPEVISKEPLAAAVRHGDDKFFDIVKWTVFALISAEELGITSKNVDQLIKSSNPDILRFLGKVPGNGKALGLDEKWAYNIVKQVGNYGESFEKHVGKKTALRLDRGLNALWTDGGLMYSPPLK